MVAPAPDLSRLRIDRDAAPAARRRWIVPLAGGLGLALLAVAGMLVLRDRSIPVVDTMVVNPIGDRGRGAGGSAGTAVTANGYVVARTRASVSAKLAGRLAELRVSEGSFIRRGEVLGRLENSDYQAQVVQAEANLTSARAQRIEAEADRAQLVREAERMRDIRARNPELVSVQDYEAAASRAAQAEARVNAATARVAAAAAGVRYANAYLENSFIRAPFTGTVLRKEAEVGEVVAPSVGGGLTRGAVVTMADLSTLEVEVDVNEAYIGRVSKSQPARITLDAYPDTTFRGSVRQVVPTADRQRATVQVKVSILDHDPRILPEMGARVDFLTSRGQGAGDRGQGASVGSPIPRIRVPAAVVKEENGQTLVWLVRGERLEPRPVQAGPVSAGFREIRSGLVGGELLLTGGVETPRRGQRVRPKTDNR